MLEEFGDLQEAATDLKVFLGEEFEKSLQMHSEKLLESRTDNCWLN